MNATRRNPCATAATAAMCAVDLRITWCRYTAIAKHPNATAAGIPDIANSRTRDRRAALTIRGCGVVYLHVEYRESAEDQRDETTESDGESSGQR